VATDPTWHTRDAVSPTPCPTSIRSPLAESACEGTSPRPPVPSTRSDRRVVPLLASLARRRIRRSRVGVGDEPPAGSGDRARARSKRDAEHRSGSCAAGYQSAAGSQLNVEEAKVPVTRERDGVRTDAS